MCPTRQCRMYIEKAYLEYGNLLAQDVLAGEITELY